VSEHARRRAALDALLADAAPWWAPSPFMGRPPWCDAHPALFAALQSLDDEVLAVLNADDARLRAFLLPHVPALGELAALTDLPDATSTPAPVTIDAWRYIPGRKAAQIDAFVAAVGRPRARLVEWCAGKGHLGRRFLMAWGGDALALEMQQALCAEGAVLSTRAGLRQHFEACDVLAPATAERLAGSHVVALHACGDLHRHLIDLAGSAQIAALDVAPCCYPLGRAEHYVPRGGPSALKLDRNALKLAVTETVTASPRLVAQSKRLSAWKLAFIALREAQAPAAAYRPFKPTPATWSTRDFEYFLRNLAAREALVLPPTLDVKVAEAAGWARHRLNRRLQLPRLAFRRALEVWLLSDLSVSLENEGFDTALRVFCPREITPRNLLITAVRD
jgi:hypothetical protein